MENNPVITGKWGWVHIEELKKEYYRQWLHEDTLTMLDSLHLTDRVFQCRRMLKDDYVRVRSTETEFVIKREVFHLMPTAPAFVPLERVKYFNSKRVLSFGIIKNIHWHFTTRRHFYTIETNGVLKTKWYFAEELDRMQW